MVATHQEKLLGDKETLDSIRKSRRIGNNGK